jgi:hypothetical protein
MKPFICMAVITAICALGASGDAVAKTKSRARPHADTLLLGTPLKHSELAQSHSSPSEVHGFDYVNDVPAENPQRPQNQEPPAPVHVQPPPPGWLGALLMAAEHSNAPHTR